MLDSRTERRQRFRNVVQSALLLGSLLVVATGMGWVLFRAAGLLWVLVITGLVVVLRPRIRPRAVLALYRAEPLRVAAAPELHWMMTELAARARLHHTPALYYVPSAVPNCFCVGHGTDAAVGSPMGLLRRLTRREVVARACARGGASACRPTPP